jgi:hypothetical protein
MALSTELKTAKSREVTSTDEKPDYLMDLLQGLGEAGQEAAYSLGRRAGSGTKAPPDRVSESLVQLLAYATPNQEANLEYLRTLRANYLLGQLAVAAREADAHPGMAEPLFLLLTNALDSQVREMAARMFFVASLHDPGYQASVTETLQELAGSREPHVRIAANQALLLLEVADLAHAGELDPGQRDRSLRQLQTYASWGQPYITGDVNLFGSSFSWAAQEALNWLMERAGG